MGDRDGAVLPEVGPAQGGPSCPPPTPSSLGACLRHAQGARLDTPWPSATLPAEAVLAPSAATAPALSSAGMGAAPVLRVSRLPRASASTHPAGVALGLGRPRARPALDGPRPRSRQWATASLIRWALDAGPLLSCAGAALPFRIPPATCVAPRLMDGQALRLRQQGCGRTWRIPRRRLFPASRRTRDPPKLVWSKITTAGPSRKSGLTKHTCTRSARCPRRRSSGRCPPTRRSPGR